MPRNVWNDIVSWRRRELNNSTEYQLHVLTTFISKEEDLKSVGELSKVCSQSVLKCLYLARTGRPDIPMVSEQACTIDHRMDQSL